MATKHIIRKGTPARTPSPEKSNAQADQPDLGGILGRFSDARAVIETACRSMENSDNYTAETSALRTGLGLLNAAYNEFDLAIRTSGR